MREVLLAKITPIKLSCTTSNGAVELMLDMDKIVKMVSLVPWEVVVRKTSIISIQVLYLAQIRTN